MLDLFQLKATPSCIGWSAGHIECFYPNKALSDSVTSSETNANIFHVLSYNTDHGGNLLREELAFDLLRNGIVMNTGFWQESLGVAAPTTELGRVTVRGIVYWPPFKIRSRLVHLLASRARHFSRCASPA
jgi:hypothetical protein